MNDALEYELLAQQLARILSLAFDAATERCDYNIKLSGLETANQADVLWGWVAGRRSPVAGRRCGVEGGQPKPSGPCWVSQSAGSTPTCRRVTIAGCCCPRHRASTHRRVPSAPAASPSRATTTLAAPLLVTRRAYAVETLTPLVVHGQNWASLPLVAAAAVTASASGAPE